MSDGGTQARATLDAWRAHGADRADPVRFHFIAALERRATGLDGEARRLLDDRLSRLLEAYAGDVEKAAFAAAEDAAAAAPPPPARGALGELLDRLASHAAAHGDGPAAHAATARPVAFPELAALEDFRTTWSQLRAESQLRQSLEPAPADAGPLNSASLVHRSLALMREISPAYLRQFLSYVDVLSWMEQLHSGGILADMATPQAPGTRKRTRGNLSRRAD